MKLSSQNRSGRISLPVLGCCFVLVSLCLLSLHAAPPAWWATHNVLDSNLIVDDYAAANQGQAKNLAKKAYLEMEAKLPGGAGSALDTLITSWVQPNAQRDDFSALNLGQLKALAKPFYDRLIAVDYPIAYPWTPASSDDQNYAAANVGQLKQVFSFKIPDHTVAPAAAGNLSAIEQQDGSVVLTWTDASDNETGFLVERSSDGGQTWQQVATLGANSTDYTHTNGGGQGISYRVTPSNGTGAALTSGDAASIPKPDEDWDQDGLVNADETEFGGDPRDEDTDNDGVNDNFDAVVYDADFTHPRVPLTSYAVIDLTPALTNLELPEAGNYPGFGQVDIDQGTVQMVLNNQGVVGITIASSQVSFHSRSWVYQNGQAQSLDTLGEGEDDESQEFYGFVVIEDINNSGLVGGYRSMLTGNEEVSPLRTEPFRWSSGQGVTAFAGQSLPGSPEPNQSIGRLSHLDQSGTGYGVFAYEHESGEETLFYRVGGVKWKGDDSVESIGTQAIFEYDFSDPVREEGAVQNTTALSSNGRRAWLQTTIDDPMSLVLDFLHHSIMYDDPYELGTSYFSSKKIYIENQDMGSMTTGTGLMKAGVTTLLEWPKPFGLGANGGVPKTWIKRGEQWESKNLPWNPNSLVPAWDNRDILISGNDRGQILYSDGYLEGGIPKTKNYLWQNGKSYPLGTLVPAVTGTGAVWGKITPLDLNNFGLIAGTAVKVKDAQGNAIAPENQKKHPVLLIPMEVNCPELYMFGGHKNDVVELCKVSGITCEWKLKNATPAIGTFDHPTDTACSFTATTEGKNTIQLLIGGKVVWEKPTEIIKIISRATWGAYAADPAKLTTTPSLNGITFHHSSNAADGAAEVLRIQDMHMQKSVIYWPRPGDGWGDIGYHFLMDKAGNVYQGRELEAAPGAIDGPYTLGSHVENNNTAAGIGICVLGDYEGTEAFPAARQEALEKALSAISRRHKLTSSKVSYHKAQATTNPTECPGSNVIPKAPDIIKNVKRNLQ